MSPNISRNVVKNSGGCRWTFQGMSPNIPGNVTKHSRDCCETFQRRSSKNPENIWKWSEVCWKTFCEKYENFRMNVYNSTRYWWSWTLPIYWRAVAVKVYFSPAGLNVALGNWKGLFIEQIENVSEVNQKDEIKRKIESLGFLTENKKPLNNFSLWLRFIFVKIYLYTIFFHFSFMTHPLFFQTTKSFLALKHYLAIVKSLSPFHAG